MNQLFWICFWSVQTSDWLSEEEVIYKYLGIYQEKNSLNIRNIVDFTLLVYKLPLFGTWSAYVDISGWFSEEEEGSFTLFYYTHICTITNNMVCRCIHLCSWSLVKRGFTVSIRISYRTMNTRCRKQANPVFVWCAYTVRMKIWASPTSVFFLP